MLFFFSVIFISIGGIFGESCWDRVMACEKDLPTDIPENEEELKSGCRLFGDAAKCIIDVEENCEEEFDEEESEQYHAKKLAAIKIMEQFIFESCQSDSHIYQVISRNLECAYPVLKNQRYSCELSNLSGNRKHVVDTYVKLLTERGATEDMWDCASEIWDAACKAIAVSDECGLEVLLPATEILTTINFGIQMSCDQEIKDAIPSFVEVVALAKEAEIVENEIDKKK